MCVGTNNTRVDPETLLKRQPAGARKACEMGGRWRRFALTREDIGKAISIVNGVVSVDGVVRTHRGFRRVFLGLKTVYSKIETVMVDGIMQSGARMILLVALKIIF